MDKEQTEKLAEYQNKIVTYNGDQVKIVEVKAGDVVTILVPTSNTKRDVHLTNLTIKGADTDGETTL